MKINNKSFTCKGKVASPLIHARNLRGIGILTFFVMTFKKSLSNGGTSDVRSSAKLVVINGAGSSFGK